MVRAEIVDESAINQPTVEESRQRLEALAWLLDSAIQIPGLRIRMGVDSLLGLIPVVGDTLSALLSTFIIAEAARLGAPRTVLTRMSVNVLADTVIGMVPLAGDVFDVAWKANRKNVRLLTDYLDSPVKTKAASRWYLVGTFALLAGFLALLGLMIVGAWRLIAAAFQ